MNISENIVKVFDLDSLSDEKKVETVERLSKLIFQSVLMRALPLLNEKDLKDYESKIDNNENPVEVFNFLLEKIPDLDKMFEEEAMALQRELSSDMESVK